MEKIINIPRKRIELVFKIGFFKIKINFGKLLKIIRFLDLIIPKKPNNVVFLCDSIHVDSSMVFYNYLNDKHKNEYNLSVLMYDIPEKLSYKVYEYPSIKGILKALCSKYVIATNNVLSLSMFKSKKRNYLYFNHGMPIKKIGLTNVVKNPVALQHLEFLGDNAQFFVTSDIFKVITSTCFSANYNNIHITGTPRNDLINSKVNDDKIKKFFNLDEFSKVVFYMPTYMMNKDKKATQTGKEFNNIFYADDYNENNFIKAIEDNKILFIMKPHPVEEFFYKENTDVLPKSKNFKIVFNNDFYSNNIGMYQLFKFVDCMVSDYSSAPIDYLILNRPVVYLSSLAEGYSKNRGMILEDNYEILMPGVKVKTYSDFEKALIDALTVDSFKQKREELLPLIHKYRDFNSCDRIYNIMKELK